MARSGGAWSVKGIDQATRDIARRAAQASGLTIGEWIDRAIRTDAGAAGHEPPQSAGHDSGDIGATGSIVSDDETIQGLEVETAGAAADGGGVPVATEGSAALSTPSSAPVLTTETLNALYARLDETDRRIEQTLKPMAYRLHDLAVRLVDAEGGSPAANLDRRHSARDDLTEETPHLDSPASALSTVRSETIAAAERARRLARPTPQPPADDFPLDASGLEPIGTLDAARRNKPFQVEPANVVADTAHGRPIPVPPSIDFDPDPISESVSADSGRNGPTVGPPLPEPANDAPGSVDRDFDSIIFPEIPETPAEYAAMAEAEPAAHHYAYRRGPGRAIALVAAVVLLFVTLTAGWFFGTGGRLDDPERMLAALSTRLTEAGQSLSNSISAGVEQIELAIRSAEEPGSVVAEQTDGTESRDGSPDDPDQGPVLADESYPIQFPVVAPPQALGAADAQNPSISNGTATTPTNDPNDVMPSPGPVPPPPSPQIAAIPEPVPSSATEPSSGSVEPTPPASDDPGPSQEADSTPSAPPSAPEDGEPVDVAALEARAAAGDPRAQHDLASWHVAQDPPDLVAAANLFRDAAVQGVANAQYNLAVLYERGQGVRTDETRALLWYHSAAEQGHPLAQYNLGVLYAAGRAVPLSYHEAARWFREAATRGVPAASYNLAVLTEGGLGMPQDRAAAMALYQTAADLGHPGAIQRLAGEVPTATGDGLLDRPKPTSSSVSLGGDEIAEIQRLLSDRGLYDGPVDGISGPRTRAAISEFQASAGLPVTGLPSRALISALGADS